jgi:hypothetical protein
MATKQKLAEQNIIELILQFDFDAHSPEDNIAPH